MHKKCIIATLGPSSLKKEVVQKMDRLGVDIFRINLSHVNLDDLEETLLSAVERNVRISFHLIERIGKSSGKRFRVVHVQQHIIKIKLRIPGPHKIKIGFVGPEHIGNIFLLYDELLGIFHIGWHGQ